jgi:hypothetical protein
MRSPGLRADTSVTMTTPPAIPTASAISAMPISFLEPSR